MQTPPLRRLLLHAPPPASIIVCTRDAAQLVYCAYVERWAAWCVCIQHPTQRHGSGWPLCRRSPFFQLVVLVHRNHHFRCGRGMRGGALLESSARPRARLHRVFLVHISPCAQILPLGLCACLACPLVVLKDLQRHGGIFVAWRAVSGVSASTATGISRGHTPRGGRRKTSSLLDNAERGANGGIGVLCCRAFLCLLLRLALDAAGL